MVSGLLRKVVVSGLLRKVVSGWPYHVRTHRAAQADSGGLTQGAITLGRKVPSGDLRGLILGWWKRKEWEAQRADLDSSGNLD